MPTTIPLKSAWSHSRLDRNLRSHDLKNTPEPRNVPSEAQDRNIQNAHRRPTERAASPTARTLSRSHRSSERIPEFNSVSRETQVTDIQDELERPSERGASNSIVAPSVIANVEPNLLSSAPRPHPAYRTLRKSYIRLLRILPASSTAEVRCQLEEISLHRPPIYTALSYTWGSQYGIHQIYVNDTPLLVPKNLFRFLKSARDLGRELSGWIWCDMLSINQVDLAERGYQVTLMSRIFHTAQTVVVWLGPAHRGSDLAMTAIAKLPNGERFSKQASRIWAGEVGPAMDDICRRHYWRRLWIFQEVRLARRILLMCGGKTVSWDKFESLLQYADARSGTSRGDDHTEFVASSPAMRMMKLNLKSVDTALWSLVQETKHLRCFDSRDKIFALLGVATKSHGTIEPDYTLGIPTLLNMLLKETWMNSPPENFDQALDLCAKVEDTFGVERGTVFIMEGQRGLYNAPSDTEVRGCRLGPETISISLWWTAFYGHSHVQTMLQNCWSSNWFDGDESISIADISHAAHAVVSLFRFLRKDMDTRHSFLAADFSDGDLADSDSEISDSEISESETSDDSFSGESVVVRPDLDSDDSMIRTENLETFDREAAEASISDLSMYWAVWYLRHAMDEQKYRRGSFMLSLLDWTTKSERKALAHLAQLDEANYPEPWKRSYNFKFRDDHEPTQSSCRYHGIDKVAGGRFWRNMNCKECELVKKRN